MSREADLSDKSQVRIYGYRQSYTTQTRWTDGQAPRMQNYDACMMMSELEEQENRMDGKMEKSWMQAHEHFLTLLLLLHGTG